MSDIQPNQQESYRDRVSTVTEKGNANGCLNHPGVLQNAQYHFRMYLAVFYHTFY